ncbi:MAG: phosphoribosylaminoimidazolesuccinocarboxamide synthase [Alicyclobacillus sp.]|nr:phosphoribosylaminoimidazolesuccinocarboxamide synthase [Alicyclobacillus sp.]
MAEVQELRYEGKAKRVYATADPGVFEVEYKDDATAFNGQKRGHIAGKGVVNNRMSNRLFRLLEQHGVPTHFIEELSERRTRVRALTMLPVEIVVRNRIAGSLASRLGLPEGTPLAQPLVEWYYKNDALGDPLVSRAHAEVLGWVSPQEAAEVERLALAVNHVLREFLAQQGVELVDFKLEFGRDSAGRLYVADEISPDTCRFWDVATGEKLDKDRFRRDLGGVEEAYAEIWKRVERGLAP